MFESLIQNLRRLISPVNVKLLVIGMESSKLAGNCPGAANDARKLYNVIRPRASYSKILISGEATKANVISEMQKVCNSDLAIIAYSGHGGQQKGSQNETDGKDELIGLYDQYMIDNEIWNIVSNAKGRVFLIFDCCHSETMFRATFLDRVCTLAKGSKEVDLLCWSACGDKELSYGMNDGGFFTKCICDNAKWNYTYDDAWNKIANNQTLRQYEIVRRTLLSDRSKFKGKKLFS